MSTMNIFDMTDTWNAGGTTFTAIKMNATDTASAAGSLLMDLQIGGVSQFSVTKGGLITAPRFNLAGNVSSAAWTTNGVGLTNAARTLTDTSSSGTVAAAYTNVLHGNTVAASTATTFTDYASLLVGLATAGTNVTITNNFSLLTTGNIGVGGTDVVLAREAADILAHRRGVNAQAFRLYNTFTDVSNFERGYMRWVSNSLQIGTEELGTGLARALELQTDGITRLTISATGGVTCSVDLAATQAAASIGTRGIPQNSKSANYTLVAADAGQHILHPTGDNNARTFTIPANSAVPFPVGTEVVFINMINTVTIAITTDTMRLSPGGTTGSRTLAANGIARAIKLTNTEWIISGSGLT